MNKDSEQCQWVDANTGKRCEKPATWMVEGPNKPQPDSHAYSCTAHTGDFEGVGAHALSSFGVVK